MLTSKGFPTLYKANTDGSREEVPIFRFSAYYVDIEHAEMAIPQDFVNVIGNAQGQTQADVPSLAGHTWFCEHGCEPEPQPGKDPAAFPSKGCPVYLQTLLLFHDCVDPDTLASAYSGTHNWDGDGPVCGDGNATDADPENGTSDVEESRRILGGAGGGPDQVVAEEAESSGLPAPTPVEDDDGKPAARAVCHGLASSRRASCWQRRGHLPE